MTERLPSSGLSSCRIRPSVEPWGVSFELWGWKLRLPYGLAKVPTVSVVVTVVVPGTVAVTVVLRLTEMRTGTKLAGLQL